MAELLYWLLNMSLMGAGCALIVYAIGRIRALPRRAAVALWLLPLVRFLIPVSFAPKLSVPVLIVRLFGRTVPVGELGFAAHNFLSLAESYDPFILPERVDRYFTTAAYLYAGVALLLLIGLGVAYLGAMAELRPAWRGKRYKRGEVVETSLVPSPLLVGVLHPRILLPIGMNGAEREAALLHEKAHLRRGDNLWRLTAIFVCCLHFFDPVVWLLLPRFFAELELACDESAVRGLDAAGRKAYGLALLGCTSSPIGREGVQSVGLSFGGAKLSRRVEALLRPRRLTVFACVCTFALLLGAALLLLN